MGVKETEIRKEDRQTGGHRYKQKDIKRQKQC